MKLGILADIHDDTNKPAAPTKLALSDAVRVPAAVFHAEV
jgi:hypothetical protein